ncbi:transcription termination factor Rho [Patescibacteria group bacterium]|nr:transcription termination factor Rho [Patescibacteria group bacterium]MBU0777323.1 transcription termination factor Rho [Patescibacteria group bacterium]MBU0846097.1 transcription termination factor Rho [Patescibacteria group bacterium]MBU0923150.1 transcription termination factor Rho [Patescibacteria group bacterium]MBU1066865.1 transcription termination factor Rho [Patescibacteria group bacterium]
MAATKKSISSSSTRTTTSDVKKVADSVEEEKTLTSSEPTGFLGKGETDIQTQEPKNLIVDRRAIPDSGLPTEHVQGVLDIANEGSGLLRPKFAASEKDIYISASQIRRFNLRVGDLITGQARRPKENERFWGLLKVEEVNGNPIDKVIDRANYDDLTAVYPDAQIILSTDKDILTTRVLDLIAPIGFGQRGLIVSPPKAGKTWLLKDILSGIAKNYPEEGKAKGGKNVHLMAALIGERPEEVTDIVRHMEEVTGGKGEVAASNFDESPGAQTRVGELALERARRLVEDGKDVVVVLDSITRMARAYNLALPTSGRTLTGGFDPVALFPAKKLFGAARRIEDKGSLTILGTCLVETGSRMDDLIYEEFKGTGNMEIHLVRKLADKRIFPAIDVSLSGTRQEELLYGKKDLELIHTLRRMLEMVSQEERTETLLERLKKSESNRDFLDSLKVS